MTSIAHRRRTYPPSSGAIGSMIDAIIAVPTIARVREIGLLVIIAPRNNIVVITTKA